MRVLRKLGITERQLVGFIIPTLIAGSLGIFLAIRAHSGKAAAGYTFRVTVPANTPSEDVVNLFLDGETYVMTKVGENVWKVAVPKETLGDIEEHYYAYSRTGLGYITGEKIGEEDVKEFDWPNLRYFSVVAPVTFEDLVTAWRWFPVAGETLPTVASSASSADALARKGDQPFQAGVLMQDYWTDSFYDLLGSTNQELLEMGATHVMIAPPWDYKKIDPLPDIDYTDVAVPAYPRQALIDHINAIKQAGLKPVLEPQICCTSVTDPASRSDKWWKKWYQEVEEFYLFHAQIAQETGVEAIYYMWNHFGLPGPGSPAYAKEKWESILTKVREIYKGKVGYTFLLGNEDPDKGAVSVWPSEALAIADQFDVLSVSIWRKIAPSDKADQKEINGYLNKLFTQGLEKLYQKTGKPLILTPAYPSGSGASKGTNVNIYGGALWEKEPGKRETNLRLQAGIYEAIMQAVAKSPYVLGVYPFGYHFMDAPLAYDYSVRAKPAAEILKGWFERFTSLQP